MFLSNTVNKTVVLCQAYFMPLIKIQQPKESQNLHLTVKYGFFYWYLNTVNKGIIMRDSIPNPPNEIFPDRTPKNKILSTLENMKVLLKHYGFEVFYDETTISIQVFKNGKPYNSHGKIRYFVIEIIDICYRNSIPSTHCYEYIEKIADSNTRNTFKDWILSKKWDGVSRLKQIQESITCEKTFSFSLKNTITLKWFTQVCAIGCREDGDWHKPQGVLIFSGKEGIGRNTFFRNLVCQNRSFYDDSFILCKKFEVRNLVEHSCLIRRLIEIEYVSKRLMPALKRVILTDKLRNPSKNPSKSDFIYTRTSFCGTCSKVSFLFEDQENSLFWVIPVVSIRDTSEIDMQQFWAEIHENYVLAKYPYWLDKEEEEILRKSNQQLINAEVRVHTDKNNLR